MLQKLKISNFAIIDNVELTFQDQFTAITGETGSGKSILLGALNLILGERADYSILRDNQNKTVIEGEWKISEDLRPFFLENDLDFEPICITRREITKEGKSRAFVNDTPVTLNVLKALTQQLIQIHSQHHTLMLRDKNFQRSILDLLGNHQHLVESYRIAFANFKKEEKKHSDLRLALSEALKERDYIEFQLLELEQLQLQKNNFEELELKLRELENAEQLIENTRQSVELIENADGLLSRLIKLRSLAQKIAAVSPNLESLVERIISTEIEIRDIQMSLEDFGESLVVDNQALDELNEKLNVYQGALRKFNCLNQDELLTVYQQFQNRDASTKTIESELAISEKNLIEFENELRNIGSQLSQARQKIATRIQDIFEPYFVRLKLEQARVEFDIRPQEKPDQYGFDQIQLLFSTNKGLQPQPIEKVASGGELSRFMLIVMTLLSDKKSLPTIIFDEIDAGVSGEVAEKIGSLLYEMSQNRQLFAITHLPQVASYGKHHLKVQKRTDQDSTYSEVVYLSEHERAKEIAQLLSGAFISEAALENAKQLLSHHDSK